MSDTLNDHLILISGKTCSGKSASLMTLRNPERVAYLNCEGGKRLPFASKFKQATVTNTDEVTTAIAELSSNDNIDVIIIDSLSFLMQMYEITRIRVSDDSRTEWGEYAAYFINLMHQLVAKSPKVIIFTSHVDDKYNEADMCVETKAVIKGGVGKLGVEAYFSCVVMAKRMDIDVLKKYENDYLHITEEDELVGYKNVFQTRHTKSTINERIRHPIGMWSINETFIDNNVQYVMDRLKQFYGN